MFGLETAALIIRQEEEREVTEKMFRFPLVGGPKWTGLETSPSEGQVGLNCLRMKLEKLRWMDLDKVHWTKDGEYGAFWEENPLNGWCDLQKRMLG